MSAKTMAEVLAEHTFADDDACGCTCDEMFYDWRRSPEQVQVEHRLHVEERLTAAGFGLVSDAAAEAWDEGYRLGIGDERTSASNIGIAGDLCVRSPCVCKIEPARTNPYRRDT